MTRRHWMPKEKIRIVLESLNTSIGIAELCRRYAVNPTVFYAWKERFIEAGKQALTRSRRNEGGGDLQAENERLKQLIGELTIANDEFKNFAGREKKMVAHLIRDEGLRVREALRLSGCSRRSYYYQTRKRTIPPDPYILAKVRETALKRPLYGTRRMAATLARELGRPINRKRIQRIYRILGWIEPQKTKNS